MPPAESCYTLPHQRHQVLECAIDDKAAALSEAERRFAELEAVMTRIAARTGVSRPGSVAGSGLRGSYDKLTLRS